MDRKVNVQEGPGGEGCSDMSHLAGTMSAADHQSGLDVELDVEEAQEELEEGGGSTDDEEEDRRQFGIYQCLPVDDREPDFESGEPTTAEEYLRRVRWEASRLPDITTSAKPDCQRHEGGHAAYASAAAAVDVPECLPAVQPSLTWVRSFLSKFEQLRQQLQREHQQQQQQWRADSHCTSPSLLTPELQQLQGLEQTQLVQQACLHIQRVTDGEGLSEQDAAWLYAYAARIEKPLHADTTALFRALLRHCARLRSGIADPGDPRLPHLNLAVALAGGCYGQDEQLAAVWAEAAEEER